MTSTIRRVYLDVCTLCRPFDEQTQIRIRLETEAVQLILSHIRLEDLPCMVSPVHRLEIDAISNFTEREYLLALLQEIGTVVAAERATVRARAEALVAQGLGPADAAHLAFAEAADADFVTTDDRLVRQCRRIGSAVWCGTPVAYCEKEDLR
ncbi:MAG: PIN domain-containing protein [Anaerolineae bacterium]|nr:PIN domain-containing protein [Anaerolineae bacterium]